MTEPGTPRPKNLDRILQIEVPVIVLLAQKYLPAEEVLRFTQGMVLEFDKSVTAPLDLLVNNRVIARGDTVKVGEKFGLQIREICDVKETIRGLGS